MKIVAFAVGVGVIQIKFNTAMLDSGRSPLFETSNHDTLPTQFCKMVETLARHEESCILLAIIEVLPRRAQKVGSTGIVVEEMFKKATGAKGTSKWESARFPSTDKDAIASKLRKENDWR